MRRLSRALVERWGIALRSVRQRLDADIVFLVGALDLGGKLVDRVRGNLELGAGVEDANGADILFF